MVLATFLAYPSAGYALPILSAVDYVGVAVGYLCLVQQTVRDSPSQRRLVRAVYGMFGFSGSLAVAAAIGGLCRAWVLSQEVACPPSRLFVLTPFEQVQMLLAIALSTRHGWRVRRYAGVGVARDVLGLSTGRANRTRPSDDYNAIVSDLQ